MKNNFFEKHEQSTSFRSSPLEGLGEVFMHMENALITARNSREEMDRLAHMLLDQPHLLPKLLILCFQNKLGVSGKACRVLEIICKQKLDYILPQLSIFVSKLDSVHKDNEVRPMAKICECLILDHYNEKQSFQIPNKSHRGKITETCFKWLLSHHKVAVKAHAMTCLLKLGTEFKWIHPDLKAILEKNYHLGSAGYKARARMVLSQIRS